MPVPSSPLRAAGPALDDPPRDIDPVGLQDAEALQRACALTAAQAAALLAEFGSLPEVLAAPRAALRRCLPDRAAGRILLICDLLRRLLAAPLRTRSVLTCWSAVEDYLQGMLAGRGRAQLRVLYLDGRNRLIRDEPTAEGSLDHVPIYPREILRRALELDSAAVILAQNHPGGDSNPSAAAIEAARQLRDGGRALKVALLDHVVIADRTLVSFRARGLL